jgi:hypothetical protein
VNELTPALQRYRTRSAGQADAIAEWFLDRPSVK